jgi:hypothetical protein
MSLRVLFRRWKAFNRRLFRGAQVVILFVSLVLLYYLGFTLTRILLLPVPRRFLGRRRRRPGNDESLWLAAEGYGLDPDELRRQS